MSATCCAAVRGPSFTGLERFNSISVNINPAIQPIASATLIFSLSGSVRQPSTPAPPNFRVSTSVGKPQPPGEPEAGRCPLASVQIDGVALRISTPFADEAVEAADVLVGDAGQPTPRRLE